MKTILVLAGLAMTGLLSGCMSPSYSEAFTARDQLKTRSYQTRAFATADREKALRAIIATMQDLGFVIDKADAVLGSVSATKLRMYELRLTATVRPHGPGQLLVRANAQYKAMPQSIAVPVEDAAPYRDFFAALEKSLFLEGQQID